MLSVAQPDMVVLMLDGSAERSAEKMMRTSRVA